MFGSPKGVSSFYFRNYCLRRQWLNWYPGCGAASLLGETADAPDIIAPAEVTKVRGECCLSLDGITPQKKDTLLIDLCESDAMYGGVWCTVLYCVILPEHTQSIIA